MTPDPVSIQDKKPSTRAKPLIDALCRKPVTRTPIWLMRQAGRYLPEYRAVREQAGGFLDLCFTPPLAAEVTLQPVRRFGLDAAILFSDILVVPHALGQRVRFEEGEGPLLEALPESLVTDGLALDRFHERLAPVYEAVAKTAARLPSEVALIGFAGAPWTVASYMVEGRSSRDFANVKLWAFRHEREFSRLIELLVEATAAYLIRQIEAGAEVLQIFDSWAGALAEAEFERWCLRPLAAITEKVRRRFPEVPIIAFPRGAGFGYRLVAEHAGVQGIGLDPSIPLRWAAEELQPRCTIQGNLDPALLVAGGEVMKERARAILQSWSHGPFIFNLGHGILPSTPPEHVASLAALVRDWRF